MIPDEVLLIGQIISSRERVAVSLSEQVVSLIRAVPPVKEASSQKGVNEAAVVGPTHYSLVMKTVDRRLLSFWVPNGVEAFKDPLHVAAHLPQLTNHKDWKHIKSLNAEALVTQRDYESIRVSLYFLIGLLSIKDIA